MFIQWALQWKVSLWDTLVMNFSNRLLFRAKISWSIVTVQRLGTRPEVSSRQFLLLFWHSVFAKLIMFLSSLHKYLLLPVTCNTAARFNIACMAQYLSESRLATNVRLRKPLCAALMRLLASSSSSSSSSVASFRFEDEDENEDQIQLLLIVRMLKSVTVMACQCCCNQLVEDEKVWRFPCGENRVLRPRPRI